MTADYWFVFRSASHSSAYAFATIQSTEDSMSRSNLGMFLRKWDYNHWPLYIQMSLTLWITCTDTHAHSQSFKVHLGLQYNCDRDLKKHFQVIVTLTWIVYDKLTDVRKQDWNERNEYIAGLRWMFTVPRFIVSLEVNCRGIRGGEVMEVGSTQANIRGPELIWHFFQLK